MTNCGKIVANQPVLFAGCRSEDGEVPCTVGFSTRGERRRTYQYVEHTEVRKYRWAWCIEVRSRLLANNAC